MRAFTSIEQSKTLAKILPIESADIHYNVVGDAIIGDYQSGTSSARSVAKAFKKNPDEFAKKVIPCWSLAALLENIPVSCDDGQHCFALINCNPKDDTEWLSCYEDCKGNLLNKCYSDNPIDACYEMIVKLNEKGLI